MWWFKRHPELLTREYQGLESDSNYKESARAKNNLLISGGEIIIRLEKNYRHAILIVYPHTFPYELPRVLLLNQVPSKELCESLSELEYGSIDFYNIIKDYIKFYYKRHQNSDGSLCLLENDNLEDEGAWFFSIHQVIKRIRDWLAGTHTNHYPPEGPEVELFVHFPGHDLTVAFLTTKPFYSHDYSEGQFYATVFNQRTIGEFTRKIYCGILVDGLKNGVFLPPDEFEFDISLLIPEIERPIDILDPEKEHFKLRAIRDGKIIQGYWWKVNEEFEPFSQVSNLALILGDGNEQEGFSRMYKNTSQSVQRAEDKIFLGIQFPNRRNEQEWVFFSLIRKKESKHVALFGDFPLEEFKSKINEYDLAVVYSARFTDESYHRRNQGLSNRDNLKDKTINVVGCGSLGSEIADTLCKAGVGHLHLIDNDSIQISNPVRHICGLEFTGFSKVDSLKARLFNSNPFVLVTVERRGILRKDVISLFQEDSILISTIADDNTESYLNEQSIINNKIVFYARALRGGKAARIFRVIPGKDACFNCLTLYKKEEHPSFIDVPEDPSLPTITNECNNPIRPGSAAELKLVSSLTSGILIDSLQNDFSDTNHWVWSKENIDLLEAFKLHESRLPPHKDCPYCKKEHQIAVDIKKSVLKFMINETQKESLIETGGILLGSFKDSKLEISFASGPGPKAKKEPTWFEKDIEFCQKFLDTHFEKHGNEGLYLGEWHYHPFKDNRPSNTDLASLTAISYQKEYLTDKPVMIILNSGGEPHVTVHPASKSYYKAEFKVI